MKTFDISASATAQNYTPQIERFIVGNTIYVIEYLSDYDSLPNVVDTWRDMVAYSG